MQIQIEITDRHTKATLQAVLPLFTPRLVSLVGNDLVLFAEEAFLSPQASPYPAALAVIFYRTDSFLTTPAYRLLSETIPTVALPCPLSVPALEEALVQETLMPKQRPSASDMPLQFSPEDKTVRWGTRQVQLTPREYHLLSLLYEHQGQPLEKKQLLAAVWPEGATGNVCEVNMTHLRQKLREMLGDGAIGSVRGKGYILRLP